ncbi:heavy-metal-associated domain-containing protein [Erysipelothrix rhusiopathiae]|nr:heavy-metal-associated domain-containing protein [Erysipelothrix rhusiopathiae]MDE8166872.1 heavy-metal-associated domain-containing protein [Erysipelothrix rhusiopathiae]
MKHIIFVDNMKCEGCVKRISEELDNTRVDYTISLPNKSVTVEGSNDTVHAAKQAIQSAGYSVK